MQSIDKFLLLSISFSLLILPSTSSAACGSISSGPTDNPVATKYGSTAYPWTGNIKWSCVFNINDYTGSSMVSRFNSARDAAVANGGGVVYFPAGTHTFTDNIYLKGGVVIRGANPSSTDAKSSSYNPPSKLVFPKYNQSLSGSGTANTTAFKKIYTTTPNTDSNLGVVNVDLNRAAVYLTGDRNSGSNRNIVVFGIRSNNTAEPDSGVPQTFQNAWQRWVYRFSANIKVIAFENALVANNRCNDAITDNFDQPNYKIKNGTTVMTLTAGTQAQFNYADHDVIDLNKHGGSSDYIWTATPTEEPSLFRKGLVVRDNWVYHTRRVGIYPAGDGLVVRDNVIRNQPGKIAWVDATGTRLVSNSATLGNRAIEWGGHNVLVTGNDYEAQQHKMKDTTYYSVDGEGILIQACCGGTTVNGATVSNNKGPKPTYIGFYKTEDINNIVISGNTVRDTGLGIYVNANINGTNFKCNNVKITSNNVDGPIALLGDVATTAGGNSIQSNTDPNGGGAISHSCESSVSISGNSGFTVNACQ